jgi:hypothetical protein
MMKDGRLVLIGAGGINCGKTHLACKLIERYSKSGPVYGLKATNAGGGLCCPHGSRGCGACAINSDFCLERENSPYNKKDTGLMLLAGACEVWRLRSLPERMADAYAAFVEKIPPEVLVIAESNSLRLVVKPAFFVMITPQRGVIKESARISSPFADITFTAPLNDGDILEVIKQINASLRKPS